MALRKFQSYFRMPVSRFVKCSYSLNNVYYSVILHLKVCYYVLCMMLYVYLYSLKDVIFSIGGSTEDRTSDGGICQSLHSMQSRSD